jgi:hypothetical protein
MSEWTFDRAVTALENGPLPANVDQWALCKLTSCAAHIAPVDRLV